MKLKANMVIIITLIILAGGIAITSALGLYQVNGTKVPSKLTAGENAGQYNPEDIKGSYTLSDIEEYFDIPVETLARAFDVKENALGFEVKGLEASAKGDTAAMRYFVTAYKGMNADNNKSAKLPQEAVNIILTEGKPKADQITALNGLKVPSASAPEAKLTSQGTGNGDGSGSGTGQSSDRAIKGKHTFAEVIAMGIPQEKIEAAIGAQIPDMSMTLRNYCKANGLEFSEIAQGLLQ